MRDRNPTEGNISGSIPDGEAADARADRDPKTVRTPAVKDALRVDAREARARSIGKHRK